MFENAIESNQCYLTRPLLSIRQVLFDPRRHQQPRRIAGRAFRGQEALSASTAWSTLSLHPTLVFGMAGWAGSCPSIRAIASFMARGKAAATAVGGGEALRSHGKAGSRGPWARRLSRGRADASGRGRAPLRGSLLLEITPKNMCGLPVGQH